MIETEFVSVYTTIDSQKKAESLAAVCVERQLVACAQIDGPITSIYRWKGQVEKSIEYRLMLKTSVSLVDSLTRLIGELHTHDVPEFNIVSASRSFLTICSGVCRFPFFFVIKISLSKLT
jgi:periplasmic divalent cation tolerance protein